MHSKVINCFAEVISLRKKMLSYVASSAIKTSGDDSVIERLKCLINVSRSSAILLDLLRISRRQFLFRSKQFLVKTKAFDVYTRAPCEDRL